MEEQLGRIEEERDYYSLNRRVYAIFAPFYDIVALPLRQLRHSVVSMLDTGPQSRVLDVATGTGEQALAFAEKAGEVVGIDLSEAMLRIARRKNRFQNVTFRQADATELPFEDRSFDISCISFALHEMPRSIREKVVLEMERVTKLDGSIIIVDYALPRNAVASFLVYHFVKLYERDHYADFVRSDLRVLLQGAGIEIVNQRPALLGLATILTSRVLCGMESQKHETMEKQSRHHEFSWKDKPGVDRKAIQEEIRKLAYQFFCECGCEHGHDMEHWLAAERKVLERVKEEQGRVKRSAGTGHKGSR